MTSTFGMDFLHQTVLLRQESNSLQRKVSGHLDSSRLPRQHYSWENGHGKWRKSRDFCSLREKTAGERGRGGRDVPSRMREVPLHVDERLWRRV